MTLLYIFSSPFLYIFILPLTYLLGEVELQHSSGQATTSPAYLMSISPSGKGKKYMFSDSFLTKAHLMSVQSELVMLKKHAELEKTCRNNQAFSEWGKYPVTRDYEDEVEE